MNKSDIVKHISSQNPTLHKTLITSIINLIIKSLIKNLKDKNRIEIRGFGSFSLRNRKVQSKFASSKLNNLVLKNRSTIYFRMGKDLFDKLNDIK